MMSQAAATPPPRARHMPAEHLWHAGNRDGAIASVLDEINRYPSPKPVDLVMQLAYYVFLIGDPAGAAGFLERIAAYHPHHVELHLNLGMCLSRSGQAERAIPVLRHVLSLAPDHPAALDSLCSCLFHTGDRDGAAQAGTRVLTIKDAAARTPDGWSLPPGDAGAYAAMPGKRDVIAFSLWGNAARYLRGAVDNVLAARTLYPGWALRFYVDDSVPEALLSELRAQGAQVAVEAPGQSERMKLGWRFAVANDPTVGRFLVRDADSVVNAREAAAVAAWIGSGRWFHVMRDYWTHTDLMLAGMWGGVAGVLPQLRPMLRDYRPAHLETPNVDQWFLRDMVWGYVRVSVLAHDRCFTPDGAVAWPTSEDEGHVGQNEMAADGEGQAMRLRDFIARMECLSG